MIDWLNLIFNALWIFALSLALAVLSYTHWQGGALKIGWRAALQQPAAQHWLNAAGALFCLGLLGTSPNLWEKVLWGVLMLGFIGQSVAEVVRKP